MPRTRDLRVENFRPLIPPAILLEELPLGERGSATVTRGRDEVSRILNGEDDRLVIVVGPCSIHDPAAALDYGHRLKALSDDLAGDLCIVMRVYFEKPRTTVGWKGLINDPRLDGSFAINEGLRRARRLLVDLAELGLPAGCEFLDPISPQFTSDLVSWGAIGARTTESQVHRELASGLSMPVGFKNGTDGGVQIAIDAVRSSAHPHSFLGVTEQGLCAIVATRGNPDCHVILRGGQSGPNHDAASVGAVTEALRAAGLPPRIMVDASHGNSAKDYRRQPLVAQDIAEQVAGGRRALFGMMLESFLADGRQDLTPGRSLHYGQSITDACMGWEMTVPVLQDLAKAVRTRRATA
ncbi:MAG TPA: 3-deoxy-7-phosphoheptulonate synthase [Methylomirabilota bacterium]|nr:3-deoxy-7-phosphoheptulonate synthase [Methylomirabilota bacterium]